MQIKNLIYKHYSKINKPNALQRWLIFLLGLLLPVLSHAYSGISIVLNANTPVHQEFALNFKQELIASKHADIKVRVIELNETEKLVVAENSELVIALGIDALEAAGKLKRTTPVIGLFTSLADYEKLMASGERNSGNFSAIISDQPYSRQFSLIKIILPKAKVLGLLIGSTTTQHADLIKKAGKQNDLDVIHGQILNEAELISKLGAVLNTTDALMAVPDPLVYTRETAQSILLTTYRHQKPVFGYSKSYVQAGALAGVYSSTFQLAKQAAEIAVDSQAAPGLLPAPQAPKYFSVAVNYQVAKAFNINIINEEDLHKKLVDAEVLQ